MPSLSQIYSLLDQIEALETENERIKERVFSALVTVGDWEEHIRHRRDVPAEAKQASSQYAMSATTALSGVDYVHTNIHRVRAQRERLKRVVQGFAFSAVTSPADTRTVYQCRECHMFDIEGATHAPTCVVGQALKEDVCQS